MMAIRQIEMIERWFSMLLIGFRVFVQ